VALPVSGALLLGENAADPAAPAAGQGTLLYVKGGQVYTLAPGGTPVVLGTPPPSALYGLRAGFNVTGGGVVSLDVNYSLSWTQRFIVISAGHATDAATSGYFDITVPAAGTPLNVVGGAPARNWTAQGVVLNLWEALYYALPVGDVQNSVPGNFYIAAYTGTWEPPPSNWLLLAVRNGDIANSPVFTCNGDALTPGQTRVAGGLARAGLSLAGALDMSSRVGGANDKYFGPLDFINQPNLTASLPSNAGGNPDMNTLQNRMSGFYNGSGNVQHTPLGDNQPDWWLVLQVRHQNKNNNYGFQIAEHMTGTNPGTLWYRHFEGGDGTDAGVPGGVWQRFVTDVEYYAEATMTFMGAW
jgi:hypothetical protein